MIASHRRSTGSTRRSSTSRTSTSTAPARVARGETALLGISAAGTPAATHVLHLDVLDPSSKAVFAYSGNLRAPAGRAQRPIPFAHNDPAGRWQIRVRDVLSGRVQTAAIELY